MHGLCFLWVALSLSLFLSLSLSFSHIGMDGTSEAEEWEGDAGEDGINDDDDGDGGDDDGDGGDDVLIRCSLNA